MLNEAGVKAKMQGSKALTSDENGDMTDVVSLAVGSFDSQKASWLSASRSRTVSRAIHGI